LAEFPNESIKRVTDGCKANSRRWSFKHHHKAEGRRQKGTKLRKKGERRQVRKRGQSV
jgi:hypothetical protein